MNRKQRMLSAAGCIMAMLVLIFDSKCAVSAAYNAVELCIKTLIPSLFPLFVLAGFLVPMLQDIRIPWLSKLLGLPTGSEGLFLVGAVGGFPMGAACISQAVKSGGLTVPHAKRMLSFCNNCGPAFIIGILGSVLGNPARAAAIFMIQLVSAVCIAILWPSPGGNAIIAESQPISLPQSVQQAIRSMANVCSWVILANVAVGYLDRWVFPLLPELAGIFLSGILELTTGCVALEHVNPSTRFLFGCIFVCFGGLCVHLQIHGLTGFGMRICLLQKAAQAALAGAISILFLKWGWVILLFPIPIVFFLKKAVEISGMVRYNIPSKGGITNAVSEKDGQSMPLLHPQHKAG